MQSKTVAPTPSQWVDGLAAASQQTALSAAKVAVLGDTVAAAGASFTDTARWECTSSRCAAVVGNLLVFRDGNHLSATFARWLAPVLDANLGVVINP